jgi:phosphonate metabolism protein (transferase hexapeptide repeat family)
MAADQTSYIDPDSRKRAKLSDAPSVDPTAQIRDTVFGRFNEVGARTRVAESVLGDYAYIANDSDIIYSEIGKFCSIASQVRINPGNHPIERPALNHFTYRASKFGLGPDEPAFFDWRRSHRVTIGHDVWIGHGATIMADVTIGCGAIIGSGAVVTKDVPDFAIVAGVPAKPLRFRFTPEICTQLKKIAWWDWSHDQLAAALMDFRKLPIAQFCARYLDQAPSEK